jgi:hypothetical protein
MQIWMTNGVSSDIVHFYAGKADGSSSEQDWSCSSHSGRCLEALLSVQISKVIYTSKNNRKTIRINPIGHLAQGGYSIMKSVLYAQYMYSSYLSPLWTDSPTSAPLEKQRTFCALSQYKRGGWGYRRSILVRVCQLESIVILVSTHATCRQWAAAPSAKMAHGYGR